MSAPKVTDVVHIGVHEVHVVRLPKSYLIYIDSGAVKHVMSWTDNETWSAMCGIGLMWAGSKAKYIPGRFVSHVDLRDVVMGVPTCIECIAKLAEEGV